MVAEKEAAMESKDKQNMERESKQLTLGSLFDGSGGFPLSGMLAGIKPIWASEIEPYPIRVTTKRFPQMKHYGDVSVINGAELEPVDIVTWGSPCQDLSIAGKRAGLEGERSGLYVQAVRIVKEMLEATHGEYPKFCVFENVPGLLSSNKGEDFLTCMDMMQEQGFIPDINILDAQHMGVAQRRKRVYITWVNVDYILRRRTNISGCITLQLLTEILLLNLGALLRAYGIEQKNLVVPGQSQFEDSMKRRIKLFSLQKEDRLQMLQSNLEEIQAKFSKERISSGSYLGEDQMAGTMLIGEGTKYESLSKESLSTSTGQLLRNALEESLQLMNESIISTQTKETIAQRIFGCFLDLRNTLAVTIHLMHSWEKEPMFLNCFEWVTYSLTEIRGYTDAGIKHFKGSEELERYDLLRIYKQEISELGCEIEQYLAEQCGEEILPDIQSLPWDSLKSCKTWQTAAGDPEKGSGETGGSDGGIEVLAADGYNGTVSEKAATLRVNCGESTGSSAVILNDQGGERMDVTKDVTATLRAEAHHPPVVLDGDAVSAGFCTEHSADSRGIGYEEEKSPTLRAGVVPAALKTEEPISLENHPNDSRVKIIEDGKVQTLSGRMGTGGGNVPLLMEDKADAADKPVTLKIRSGCEGGGKGSLLTEDLSATLGTHNDQTLFEPVEGGDEEQTAFGISSFESHAMLSDNPHAGIYEAKTSRTLDVSGGNPSCNQGGICIVAHKANYDVRFTSDGSKVSRGHVYETDTARTLSTDTQDPAGNH